MPKNSYVVSGKKKSMNRADTSSFAHPVCTLWKKKTDKYAIFYVRYKLMDKQNAKTFTTTTISI
jgi:hypothetical protein